MSKEERLAKDITHALGGSQNISNIIHCMTRVRIKVHNYAKVNYDELKSINGVLGVVEDERIQVVVGPGIVNKVAKHMADQSGATLAEETTENQSYKSQAEKRAYEHKQQFQSQRKQSKWNKVLKSIANIFIPLIPAFIGAGLIGGIAAILSTLLTAGSISGQWI
ncbi:permease, partial [Xanthomonas sp. LMG 8992]